MLNAHKRSIVCAYRDQELLSESQHRLLFHAYNFCQYTGLLRSLFITITKPNVLVSDILENDAFLCTVLATDKLSRILNKGSVKTTPEVLDLWRSTEAVLHSVRSKRIAIAEPITLNLLHLAGLQIYHHFQSLLLDDMSTYRQIAPCKPLIEFAKNLSPEADLFAYSDIQSYRVLSRILQEVLV